MSTTTNIERSGQPDLEALVADAQRDVEKAQQLATDASKLLGMSADRLNKYKDKGFVQRCWLKFSGKLDELSRANQSDMINMQGVAAQYLEALQKQNLIQAHAIAIIRNNLKDLVDAETETRMVVIELMKRFDDRIGKLENAVKHLPLHDWLLTIETKRYGRLQPSHRMLKVVFDLFRLMQRNGIPFDQIEQDGQDEGVRFRSLKSALEKAGLDYEDNLTILDFVTSIVDELLDDKTEGEPADYASIVSLELGGKSVTPQFVLENVSGSGFNAVYTILERIKYVREISPLLAVDDKRAVINEWLKGVVSNLDTGYSVAELAEEILAGSFIAMEIFEEQFLTRELPPVADEAVHDSASSVSPEALLGKHVGIRFHVFAADRIPLEQRQVYVESLSLVAASMDDFSDRQRSYMSALSRIIGIDDCGARIDFLRTNPRQIDVQKLASVLDDKKRQYTWMIDAIFLASSGKESSSAALDMIRKIGEVVDIKQSAMNDFLQHAKTISTKDDAREIIDAILFMSRKTMGWKSVLDFRKISFKGAFDGLSRELSLSFLDGGLQTSFDISRAHSDLVLGVGFTPFGDEGFIQRQVIKLGRQGHISKFNELKKRVEGREKSVQNGITRARAILDAFGMSPPHHSRSLFGVSPDEDTSISNGDWGDNMSKAFDQLRDYLENLENETSELGDKLALIESDDWNVAGLETDNVAAEELLVVAPT